jgi:Cu-Zn family superoxide dismutase
VREDSPIPADTQVKVLGEHCSLAPRCCKSAGFSPLIIAVFIKPFGKDAKIENLLLISPSLAMKNRVSFFRPAPALTAALAAAVLTACATPAPKPLEAIVKLHATQQQPDPKAPVTGELRFKQWQEDVLITGRVEHLPPRTDIDVQGNALHIHAGGDCSAPDPASASGIFNPTHKKHSYPGAGMVGDLPMLIPDQHGAATVNYLSPLVKLDGPDSVIGKTVIVHRNLDNWALQPDGQAGPAIACGVIQAVTSEEK